MIANDEQWHFIDVKVLSRLLTGIIADHHGDYCCKNCLYSFRTENKLKSTENVCKDHEYCHMIMPEEGKTILIHYQNRKSLKALFFFIYAITDMLLEKLYAYDNNPERSFARKIKKYYSMWLFIANNVHSNIIHSMITKTNVIFTEVLTTRKGSVQT